MGLQRVVVTGIGTISPLGHDAETHFSSLIAGKSGVRYLDYDYIDKLDCKIGAPVTGFDPLAHFVKNKAATIDRVTQFGLVAAQQAITDSGLNLEQENRERIGIYLGTGMGGAASIEEGYVRLYRDNANRLKPFTVLMAMNNAAASQIALDFNLLGPNFTYCTACSSSTVAIGEAWRLIRTGEADAMLAGGSEALLTFGTIKAWEALRTLADEDPNDVSKSCKPFSKNRSGLVLGEGAAIVVLESLEHAQARGAKIYGEIIGYGSGSDSSHITKPSPEGQARAIKAALTSANLAPQEVDYINAHGTGTVLNDATETAAIKLSFGDAAHKVAISSTKSLHGHLMGATGAVEFVSCLLAMKHQTLPPTANLDEPDPACDLDYVANVARTGVKVDTVMSTSFAFGGTSGVLIARKL
ncbi:MAG: beta-ketoacyl-[acyl-carrier-protein] synthase family protein [Methylophilaceae bacterium]